MFLNMYYSFYFWRDFFSFFFKYFDQVIVYFCRESEGDGGGDEEDSFCYLFFV